MEHKAGWNTQGVTIKRASTQTITFQHLEHDKHVKLTRITIKHDYGVKLPTKALIERSNKSTGDVQSMNSPMSIGSNRAWE